MSEMKMLEIITLVSIDFVEPNQWNANVMTPEAFNDLKTAMNHAGNLSFWDEPHAAIVVSSYVNFYGKPSLNELVRFVIVDGYHRWKAAQELGWTEVGVKVTAQTEEQAQQYAYQVNKNRGTLNPIREAELFKLDVDRKMTAAQIAERYGSISESYVKSRLQLLKISPTVKHLYENPGEAFRSTKADELAHDMRSEDEEKAGEEPAEDLRQMAEGRVAKIVPRGTLTTSHLEAIASLPEESQKKISLEIVEEDLNIRRTEQLVNEAKGKIRAHNKFVKALEEAIQKTCPMCGSSPEDWQGSSWMWERGADTSSFRCSRRGCYTFWDPKVKAKDAPEKELSQSAIALRETELRAQKMKQGRENPAYILLEQTSKELHEKTVPWLLAKVKEFTYVTRVDISGRRGDETVSLDYRAPGGVPGGGYGRYDLNFTIADSETDENDSIDTYPPNKFRSARDFRVNIEEKEYKRTKAIKSKVELTGGTGTPEVRARGRRFFSEIVKTGQDPFLPEDPEGYRAALEVYGDPDSRSYNDVTKGLVPVDLVCARGLKVIPAKAYETCIEAVRKDCPTELQKICQMRGGKVDIGTARAKGD